jgi:hypothetical protein
MPADKRPTSGEDQMIYKTFLALAGALALVVLLLPSLIGFGVFFLFRAFFRRRDYILLLLGSVVILAAANGALPEYFRFITSLFGLSDKFFSPTLVVAVVALSGLALGIIGLSQGTAIAARIPSFFRPKSLGEKPSIIPTQKERQQLADIVLPSPSHTGSLGHSLMGNQKPGERLVVLGVDRAGAPIGITEREIGTHALVFGSTGSGKTESIKTLAGGLLDLGWEGILLDLKEDTKAGGLRDWCETYSHAHAISYQELRLSDPNPRFWFDVLSGLSQDEARDTILSLSRFDDEYYKSVSIKLLGQLLKLRFWAHEVDPVSCPLPTLSDIAETLEHPLAPSTKKWRAIVQQARPDLPAGEFQLLSSPTDVVQKQAESWGAKLGGLYQTQAGIRVLRAPSSAEHRPKMDVTTGGLIYIGLDSQGKPDLTRLVSSSVLQRISVEAAQRTTGQNGTAIRPKFLIVDEANWVDRTIVQNLLSRARSAGISMVLCTQGPMDWIDRDGNDFAKLAQNTNIAMIMKQGEPEAAELCADYIGTVDYQKFTQRIDEGSFQGGGSLMERTEHIVTPNELRGLGTGEMIIRVSTPSVRTEWLRVEMRDPSVIHGAAPQNVTPRPEQKNRSRFEGRRPPEQTPPGGTNGLARPPLD